MNSFHPPSPRVLRVIVADDHEWIRAILVEIVRQTLPTAEVVETGDGLEALRAFRTGKCDFLVSNHAMPRLDGPSLMRQVRQEAPDLPIVAISTNAEERLDAMAAGANWFMTKEQIMERLPKLLRLYAVDGAGSETGPEAGWQDIEQPPPICPMIP